MAPTKSYVAEVTGKTKSLSVSPIEQTACTASSITFGWTTTTTDPEADGIVFDVYRNTAYSYSNKGTLLASNQTVLSYVDAWSELITGTCYYYSVVPKMSGSTTEFTGVTNTELHTTPFNAPTNVTVSPGRKTLSVSWDGVPKAAITTGSVNYYEVSYAPHGSSSFESVITRTTSAVISYLNPSTSYDVTVTVANSGSPKVAGSKSAIVQATPKSPLAAMADITLAEETATDADKTNIRVSWTSVPDAGFYKVYYRIFAGGYSTLGYTTASSSETSTALLVNAGNRYIIYFEAIAADDPSATSLSGVKYIRSAKTVSEAVILSSGTTIVKAGTSEIMDLNNADTWTSGVIPRSTDSGYSIGILKPNLTTTTQSCYFKMKMLPAMLSGAPKFIMIDYDSMYRMDTDGNGTLNYFGAYASIYAVSPSNLSTATEIVCPTVSTTTSPKNAGTSIKSGMVYNNTLYLRLDSRSTSSGDGSVGLSAYY